MVPKSTAHGRASILVGIVFIGALILGPGPGVALVNPSPEHEGPTPTVLGLPIVYAWGLLWFAVQVACLLLSYFCLWSEEEDR